MFEISATVRDMENVLNDVISYFEAKDRIERFNKEYKTNESIEKSRDALIELVQKCIDGVDLKEEAMQVLREKIASEGIELKDENERDTEFGETFDEEGASEPKQDKMKAHKVVKIKRKVVKASK
jgi:hypothetical protein